MFSLTGKIRRNYVECKHELEKVIHVMYREVSGRSLHLLQCKACGMDLVLANEMGEEHVLDSYWRSRQAWLRLTTFSSDPSFPRYVIDQRHVLHSRPCTRLRSGLRRLVRLRRMRFLLGMAF